MTRSTPARLKLFRFLLLAADLFLFAGCVIAAGTHRTWLQTIARDTAPSMMEAQAIKASLAHMDAEAIRAMLSSPADAESAIALYEVERQNTADSILRAAANIKLGERERAPIRRLQLNLGNYEARVQKARDLCEKRDPACPSAYSEAANVLNQQLFPAADQLDEANQVVLDSFYKGRGLRSTLTRGLLIMGSVLFVYALIAAQVFLTMRTRRIFNLPLVAATLIAVAWGSWALITFYSQQSILRTIRMDAFISIDSLLRARASALSALDDSRRCLLDRVHCNTYRLTFDQEASHLLRLPPDVSVTELASKARMPGKITGASGLLVDELNNLTFSGERDAARQTILNWGEYLRVDGQVHYLEARGKHNEAVALSVASNAQGEQRAFSDFDRALEQTLRINKAAFDKETADGFYALQFLEWKAAAIAAVTALLIISGIGRRLAEYR